MKTLNKSEIYAKAVKLEQKYVSFETIRRYCNDPEILEIILKIRHRRKILIYFCSVKEFCDNLIKKRLLQIAEALPDEGYSMGSKVYCDFAKLSAKDDRTKEYAQSAKYKAQHGSVSLTLSLNELKHTCVVGELVTHIYPNQKSKVKKCSWYVSEGKKQFFHLKKYEGFIFAEYHGYTKESALKGGQKNIEREKLQQLKSIKFNKAQQLKSIKFNKALRLRYSFEDSLKAGNCEAGTRAFCIRLQLKENKKYRGKYILDAAKEKSNSAVKYVERMINYRANMI